MVDPGSLEEPVKQDLYLMMWKFILILEEKVNVTNGAAFLKLCFPIDW